MRGSPSGASTSSASGGAPRRAASTGALSSAAAAQRVRTLLATQNPASPALPAGASSPPPAPSVAGSSGSLKPLMRYGTSREQQLADLLAALQQREIERRAAAEDDPDSPPRVPRQPWRSPPKSLPRAKTAADLLADPGAPRSGWSPPRGGGLPEAPVRRDLEYKVAGKGLTEATVLETSQFSIETFDASGARSAVGGATFFVAIRGASRARSRITDNNDGTYTVEWKVRRAASRERPAPQPPDRPTPAAARRRPRALASPARLARALPASRAALPPPLGERLPCRLADEARAAAHSIPRLAVRVGNRAEAEGRRGLRQLGRH